MSDTRATAVFDVGKTNVKLVLFDKHGGLLWQKSTPNAPVPSGVYPHAAVDKIWNFLLESLKEAGKLFEIRTIVPATHGACGALVNATGLVLPIMDYEFSPQDISARYNSIRQPFSNTFSPSLPNGLNLGRQFAYQAWHFPEEFAEATHVLTYPQYWAWRLSGALASDVTSLGCHTDLWVPKEKGPSALAEKLDISRRLPPVQPSWTDVGYIRPEIADQAGLPPDVSILCGIHDSNAALLPYMLKWKSPFTVLSTGTWVIFLSVGLSLDKLRADADMMANIDATGQPTACARFMGGREYAEITGNCAAPPSIEQIDQLISSPTFALPSFSQHGGPFSNRTGRIIGEIAADQRSSLATLYCALMTDYILSEMGADIGDIIVDGSFAKNPVFCSILAQLRPAQTVICAEDQAGTARGASLLATWPNADFEIQTKRINSAQLDDLVEYREKWLMAQNSA